MKLKSLITSFGVVFTLILSGCEQSKPAAPAKEVSTGTDVLSEIQQEQKAQDERMLKRTMDVYDKILELDASLPSLQSKNSKCNWLLIEDILKKTGTMLDDEFRKELSESNKKFGDCHTTFETSVGKLNSIYFADADYAIESVIRVYTDKFSGNAEFWDLSNKSVNHYALIRFKIGEAVFVKNSLPRAFLREGLNFAGDLLSGKPGNSYDEMDSELNDWMEQVNAAQTKLDFLNGLEEGNDAFRKQFITHMENKYHVTLPAKYHAK